MLKEHLIPADEICVNHNIEISFISSLHKNGLIDITIEEEAVFIPQSQLRQLEKMIHLYYELDINLEGIETINHLLNRIDDMQYQITVLKNRLRLYEND